MLPLIDFRARRPIAPYYEAGGVVSADPDQVVPRVPGVYVGTVVGQIAVDVVGQRRSVEGGHLICCVEDLDYRRISIRGRELLVYALIKAGYVVATGHSQTQRTLR